MNENNQDFLKEINSEIGKLMGQETELPDQPNAVRRGLRAEQQTGIQLSRSAIRWIVVLSLVVLLVGGCAATYGIMLHLGQRSLRNHIAVDVDVTAPEGGVVSDGGDTITWNGKTYEKKTSVINILCMGIDKTAEELEEDAEQEEVLYGNGGQADTVFLAVLDLETGKLTLLNISRDSMTDVDVYNMDGEYVGTEEMQVCLAHAYGDGGESSCLNMVKAVSGLMYGIPVDAYASMDLPGINILNNAVGGVEVTVLEDLSDRHPSLVKGEKVLLKDNMAEIYVRARNKADLSSNNDRMARQRQYVVAFLHKAYTAARADFSTALTLYQTVKAYTHTSFTLPQTLYLVSVAIRENFREQDIVTIPGDVTMGESFAEYHVYDDELFEIILDTYYQEVS